MFKIALLQFHPILLRFSYFVSIITYEGSVFGIRAVA